MDWIKSILNSVFEDNIPALISSIVGGIAIIVWTSNLAISAWRSYKNRFAVEGVYYSTWIDPIKKEINFSLTKLVRKLGSFYFEVLYAHRDRHNCSVKLDPYRKNEDIFFGWWKTKGGNPIYKGPLLLRYQSGNFEGKWLGLKENHEISGGLFIFKKSNIKNNRYLKYKKNRFIYAITHAKFPRKESIISDIIKKHQDGNLPPYVSKEIEINIPQGCFHPELGKISKHLLDYAKSCIEKNSYVLDLGTGSGLYAIVLAKRLNCKVVGVDINSKDIATAQENASSNDVSALSSFITVNEKDPFGPISTDDKFDLIIANLPFTRTSMILKTLWHPLTPNFHGSRWLLERMILGSAYHIKPKGKLIFAYAESGYMDFLDDMIAISPWRVHSKRNMARSNDDSFYIYDLRLKDEFVELLDR